MKAEDAWLDQISDIFQNWMVINAYNARDNRSKRFKTVYTDFYNTHRKSRFFQLGYQWIAKFTNEVCIAGVFVFGAMLTTGETPVLTIGQFTALLKIFSRIGGRLVKISGILIKFQRGIEGLRRVSEMLNNPIGVNEELVGQKVQAAAAEKAFNLAHRKKPGGKWSKVFAATASGSFRARGPESLASTCALDKQQAIAIGLIVTYIAKTRTAQSAQNGTNAAADDGSGSTFERFRGGWTENMIKSMLSIQLDKITFSYPDAMELHGQNKMINKLTATIPLGYFVALVPEVAGAGGGVTTLMKLVTAQLYANSGELRIPPHLHTLMVHHEPLVLSDSLLQNLLFGNRRDVEEGFVWKVAAALGLSQKLLVKGAMRVGTGGFSLRLVDRQVVCLARALLVDPHVLVLAKPAANFAKEHAAMVFRVLKDWQERTGLWEGVGVGSKAAPDQDPILNTRTLIFGVPCASHDIPEEVDLVATVCHLERGTTIKLEPRKALFVEGRSTVALLVPNLTAEDTLVSDL